MGRKIKYWFCIPVNWQSGLLTPPLGDITTAVMSNTVAQGCGEFVLSPTMEGATSLNAARSELHAQNLLNFYDQSELLTIRGPYSGGLNFEAEFARLGGRVTPGRFKDAIMQEFGIMDLFIPPTGLSQSGFYIVERQLFK